MMDDSRQYPCQKKSVNRSAETLASLQSAVRSGRLSRRDLLRLSTTAAGFAVATKMRLRAEEFRSGYEKRSRVSVIQGEERRQIVHDSLKAIKDQIEPELKKKEYIVIKPNNVSTRRQLAATHVDTLRGIIDFVAPYRKPVVIAESSAGVTHDGFENFFYTRLPGEYKNLNISLVDLNRDGRYKVIQLLDANLHPMPTRLALRLLDPYAYTICAAILKTHNTVIATLSVKNMTLGAPLHSDRSLPKEQRWNDKRNYHEGVRQTHYSMYLTAAMMAPYWGATVIDGFEGMEGNGPASGTPVDSKIAIASTDYIAADRVGLEAMGIDPEWIGYLNFCHQAGIGQYDLDKIDIIGEDLAKVKKEYVMHKDIERELLWMGPMEDLPPKLG